MEDNTKEAPIYQIGHKVYCEQCKPRGAREKHRGTLRFSGEVYCDGCGEDFMDIVERQAK